MVVIIVGMVIVRLDFVLEVRSEEWVEDVSIFVVLEVVSRDFEN